MMLDIFLGMNQNFNLPCHVENVSVVKRKSGWSTEENRRSVI